VTRRPPRAVPSRAGIPIALLLSLGAAPVKPAPRPASAVASPLAAPLGSVEGQVEVAPSLAARRPRFRIYGDVGLGAMPPDARAPRPGEMSNVVVYLEPRGDAPRPELAPPSHPAEMRQDEERFEPRMLAVTRGTTVSFPNDDDVYHNVFSLARARTFDLGRYPKGSTRTVRFERAGVVQVFCHIHADMSATVLVLDTPFFATPAADGRFRLDGVPPGDYTIVGWHERARPVRKRVRVVAGESARAALSIPLPPEAEEP
jgi:plastocyanin